MGILNVTPDSFSDGSVFSDPAVAISAGLQMMREGADVIDVGGESTRPGAQPVPEQAEQARVLPVVAALARAGATVSIDTRHASTMARALDAGARIVNDVTALTHDPRAMPLVARRGCPVVLMHMRGTPTTMAGFAHYEDVAAEVASELSDRVAAAEAAGVSRARIAVDPGFGFAKTAEQDVALMRQLPALARLGCPILVGISRKRTVRSLAEEDDPMRCGSGSVAAALFAVTRGASILRVHDVAATRQAVAVWRGLAGA